MIIVSFYWYMWILGAKQVRISVGMTCTSGNSNLSMFNVYSISRGVLDILSATCWSPITISHWSCYYRNMTLLRNIFFASGSYSFRTISKVRIAWYKSSWRYVGSPWGRASGQSDVSDSQPSPSSASTPTLRQTFWCSDINYI